MAGSETGQNVAGRPLNGVQIPASLPQSANQLLARRRCLFVSHSDRCVCCCLSVGDLVRRRAQDRTPHQPAVRTYVPPSWEAYYAINSAFLLPKSVRWDQYACIHTFHPGIEAPKFRHRVTDHANRNFSSCVALVMILMIVIYKVSIPSSESCYHNERPSVPL